jgi:hypothetical protein
MLEPARRKGYAPVRFRSSHAAARPTSDTAIGRSGSRGIGCLAARPECAGAGRDAIGGNAGVDADDLDVLYVQTFAGGEVSDAGEGAFTLSLSGGTGQTVYFSNHPERLAGALPTLDFLDARAFDASNPPNAALVAETPEGQTIAVVELLDPAYDPGTMTVTYRVQAVADELSPPMTSFQELAGELAPGTLGAVSIFVDDLACGSNGSSCHHNSQCCSGLCCDSYTVCEPWTCQAT